MIFGLLIIFLSNLQTLGPFRYVSLALQVTITSKCRIVLI
jgi:hypothetical protein